MWYQKINFIRSQKIQTEMFLLILGNFGLLPLPNLHKRVTNTLVGFQIFSYRNVFQTILSNFAFLNTPPPTACRNHPIQGYKCICEILNIFIQKCVSREKSRQILRTVTIVHCLVKELNLQLNV